MAWCSVCDIRPVRAKGMCATCYAHRRRTGSDRDEALMIRENVRRLEATLEARALPSLRLYASQRAQRPSLRDRAEEAMRERQERLRREK